MDTAPISCTRTWRVFSKSANRYLEMIGTHAQVLYAAADLLRVPLQDLTLTQVEDW